MNIKIIISLSVFLSYFSSLAYNHPGSGSFVEVGAVRNRSTFGYKVHSPYAVPKFISGPVTLEAFRLNADLLEFGDFKIGPMAAYNFTPYAGTEIDTLKGMKRSGFLEAGILGSLSIPMGMMFFHATKAFHDEPGNIFKIALATGIPLMALNENHIWLNILTEYTYLTKATSSYMFGVRDEEATTSRTSHTVNGLTQFTLVAGLWTPITNSWWINLTYKFDNFDNKILKSPIVSRDKEETLMLGIMYSFGDYH